MKILLINPHWYKREDIKKIGKENIFGGGERYIVEIAKTLSRRQGIDVTLLSFGSTDAASRLGNLNLVVLKSHKLFPRFNGVSNPIFTLRNLRSFINLIKENDCIHANQYSADITVLSGVLSRLWSKKFFVTDLGWRGLNFGRFFPTKLLVNQMLILTEYEVSQYKLLEGQYTVIYGGVDLDSYEFSTSKEPQVIFLGRCMPHKGINYLLEGLDPEIKCVVICHPGNKAYLKYLRRLSKNKKVEFILSPSDAVVSEYLQKSSALVLPSVHKDVYGKFYPAPELFGLVIAEAFACGTPAIVSDAAALPYVVENGVTGYVVPQNDSVALGNCIKKLLANPGLVISMGKEGRRKVEEKYNWEFVADTCIHAYQKP